MGRKTDWEALFREEERIVSRVWEALGISTYEQAGGKAIFEIVKEQREMNLALVTALEDLMDDCSMSMSPAVEEAARTALAKATGEQT